ncbi:MAG: YtxH domain-containing protein [Clostridia bacterium]|nr:YtxH domain-containing protein [Clostridia bacterium]
MSQERDWFLGFLAGGLVGFLAGLMLAPAPGAEIRGRVRNTARQAADRLQETAERARERLPRLRQGNQQAAETVTEAGTLSS